MEMNFKQGVVDYVNQSLLQMTTCDVKNKRYERTVFAERLGEMNLRWHRLRGSLAGKVCPSFAVPLHRERVLWIQSGARRSRTQLPLHFSPLKHCEAGPALSLGSQIAASGSRIWGVLKGQKIVYLMCSYLYFICIL